MLSEATATLHLTGRYAQGRVALIDADDLERLGGKKWNLNADGYVKYGYAVGSRTTGTRKVKSISLHRAVLGDIPEGMVVDHINGNPLDCRKANLRIATPQQNCYNVGSRPNTASRYKGVYKTKGIAKPWLASSRKNGKLFYYGTFRTEEEAARAYDANARALFGTFARLNFQESAA